MVFRLESTSKRFSSNAGGIVLKKLVERVGLKDFLSERIPTNANRMRGSGFLKFMNIFYGFQLGCEHLDDWDDMRLDDCFAKVAEKTYGSKSLGNFLRSFRLLQIKELSHKLIDLSYSFRSATPGVSTTHFILDIDSSCCEQYGKKMEGVEACFKGFLALDKIVAHDELGFQYWHDVRPGATYTSLGSVQIIHDIFSRMPKSMNGQRRIVRADSGFANEAFFNACAAKSAGFVTAMKRTEEVMSKVYQVKNWKASKLKDRHGRPVEIGHIAYHHTNNTVASLRLVVMRAKREVPTQKTLFPDEEKYYGYDYYVFCTNMGQHEYSDEKIILLYRGRGNAENFIKELKYGFDLKHYPCQSLTANKAFGIIAAFAYVFMRFLSLSKPSYKKTKDGVKTIHHYAKRIRQKWLHIPTQVIHHAGYVTFLLNKRHFREVYQWLETIKILQFGFS